jgi:hypothetical protein
VKCSCPNCDWSGDTSELDPVGIEVFQRIEPGDTFPNGECPECEALVSIAEPLRDAAPDLLAALENLRGSIRHRSTCRAPQAFPCSCDADQLWEMSGAAIAKAKGGAK